MVLTFSFFLSLIRVLTIGSRLEQLPDIVREILNFTDERPPATKNTEEREAEMRMLVHTSHAGGIIGRGGKRIQELREATKASIKVFTECCPQSNERVISITGNTDIVIRAMITLLEVVLEYPVKGSVQLYDPIHSTSFPGLDYGGYSEPTAHPHIPRSSGPRGPTGPVMRASAYDSSERRSSGGGSWPRSSRLSSSHARESVPYPRIPWIIAPMDGFRSYFDPYHSDAVIPEIASSLHFPSPHLSHQPSTIRHNSDGSYSTTLTVSNSVRPTKYTCKAILTFVLPLQVAGAIIGKGGSRIRQLRSQSQADISIEGTPSGSDRKISIKGRQDQVKNAYLLLQKR